MPAERSSLVRQWSVLRMLGAQPSGLTVRELATETKVSENTVRRDLRTFQKAGFPIAETVEEYGRKKWRIEPGKAVPDLGFTFEEAASLYLGRRLLEPLAGTVLWEASRRAFQKIRAGLGQTPLQYLERFASVLTRPRLVPATTRARAN